MVESVKLVENALLKKKIKQYKIIDVTTKCLWYKKSFKDISYDSSILNKVFVVFKNDNKISRFGMSPIENKDKIDLLIKNSLENSYYDEQPWYEEKLSIEKSNCNEKQTTFCNFDSSKLFYLLKNKFNFIEKSTNFEVNISYNFNINRHCLLTNNFYCEQFYRESDLLCMENVKFQKRLALKNLYLNDNFSERIINELNKDDLIWDNKNIFNNKLIIIKKEALANILNEFIVAFYANLLYNGQSFINKEQLGKTLYKKDFSIISLPFEDIYFDLDGNLIKEKTIILNGRVVNFLGNRIYSQYLNVNSFGNTDLENPTIISHQRLKFNLNDKYPKKISCLKNVLTIDKFENIICDFENQSFSGLAICENNSQKFYENFNIDFSDFFNNIFSLNEKSQWIDNVYCTDIILAIERE